MKRHRRMVMVGFAVVAALLPDVFGVPGIGSFPPVVHAASAKVCAGAVGGNPYYLGL